MSGRGPAAGLAGICVWVVLMPIVASLVLGVTAESRVVRALEHRVVRVMQRICERAQPAERLRWCAASRTPPERLRAWADDELDTATARLRVNGVQVGARWTQRRLKRKTNSFRYPPKCDSSTERW
jgi:hypothetical protein